MVEEIVPYEDSLALSQIGFVQSCWHAYHDLTWPSKEDKHKLETIHSLTSYMSSHAHQYINPVLAPTYSQAFRWFRQKGYIVNIICDAENVNHRYMFDIFYDIQFMFESRYEFETYEEAELACLKKLIEIVKT